MITANDAETITHTKVMKRRKYQNISFVKVLKSKSRWRNAKSETVWHGTLVNQRQNFYLFKKLLFTMENATAADSSQSNISRIYIWKDK